MTPSVNAHFHLTNLQKRLPMWRISWQVLDRNSLSLLGIQENVINYNIISTEIQLTYDYTVNLSYDPPYGAVLWNAAVRPSQSVCSRN